MLEINWDRKAKAYILKSAVTLPVSRETLFDFFSDAFQLEQITPPLLQFKVLTPPPINIQAGTLIEYKLKLRGFPIRWRTEISTWDPPFSFTDRQLKGPYYLWEHLHTFHDTPNGTVVNDTVKYRVPGGRLVHALMVKNDLMTIFGYRQSCMQEIFATGQPGTSPSS
ncbi:MAG: SRPBCC family protein [Fuerstiella sp.]